MTTETEEIKDIQRQIVKALEEGKSTTKLTKQLADARAKIAEKIELEALQREVDHRQELRERAHRIVDRAAEQAAAVTVFLQRRDEIISALRPVVELAKSLPILQEKAHQHDGLTYHGWDPQRLPASILDGVSLPKLVSDGPRDPHGISAEAVTYLSWALGLLSSLKAIERDIPTRAAAEFENDL